MRTFLIILAVIAVIFLILIFVGKIYIKGISLGQKVSENNTGILFFKYIGYNVSYNGGELINGYNYTSLQKNEFVSKGIARETDFIKLTTFVL